MNPGLLQKKRKMLIIQVLVNIVIGIGFFLLLEYSLGVLRDRQPPSAFKAHPDVFWVLSPNLTNFELQLGPTTTYLDTNSSSMRSDQIETARSDRSFRIVCLGDESTFGLGVSQKLTYPALLQQQIRDKFHFFFTDVINGGVPGYTTCQGLDFFREYCLQFKPDILVINLLHNDMEMETLSDSQRIPSNRLIRDMRSRLFDSQIFLSIFSLVNRRNYNEYLSNPGEGQVQRVPPVEYRKNLEEIVKLARKNGIVVIFINPQIEKNAKEPYNYRVILEQTAQEAGYVIDISQLFKRDSDYYLNDRVPNEKGHQAIAQKIFETIRYHSLIPRQPGEKISPRPEKPEMVQPPGGADNMEKPLDGAVQPGQHQPPPEGLPHPDRMPPQPQGPRGQGEQNPGKDADLFFK